MAWWHKDPGYQHLQHSSGYSRFSIRGVRTFITISLIRVTPNILHESYDVPGINVGVVARTINSLFPGRCGSNFKSIIFIIIIQNSSLGDRCDIALGWMSLNPMNERSTLVLVMAWCRQATSHYQDQCWPRVMTPYDTTRPQGVKTHQINANITLS